MENKKWQYIYLKYSLQLIGTQVNTDYMHNLQVKWTVACSVYGRLGNYILKARRIAEKANFGVLS